MEIKSINAKNKIKYEKIASYLRYAIICGLIFVAGFFIGRNYPDILNQPVNLFERYSPLITAIATVVLVVATVALVVATMLLVKYNKKLWRTQNEPLLYFYKNYFMHKSGKLNISSQHIGFFVKNVGKGPAIEVKLNVRSGQQEYYINALSPGEKSLIFFTPKKCFDGFSGEATIGEVTIDDITYKDLNGFKYSHKKVTFEPDEPLGLGQAIELIGDY